MLWRLHRPIRRFVGMSRSFRAWAIFSRLMPRDRILDPWETQATLLKAGWRGRRPPQALPPCRALTIQCDARGDGLAKDGDMTTKGPTGFEYHRAYHLFCGLNNIVKSLVENLCSSGGVSSRFPDGSETVVDREFINDCKARFRSQLQIPEGCEPSPLSPGSAAALDRFV